MSPCPAPRSRTPSSCRRHARTPARSSPRAAARAARRGRGRARGTRAGPVRPAGAAAGARPGRRRARPGRAGAGDGAERGRREPAGRRWPAARCCTTATSTAPTWRWRWTPRGWRCARTLRCRPPGWPRWPTGADRAAAVPRGRSRRQLGHHDPRVHGQRGRWPSCACWPRLPRSAPRCCHAAPRSTLPSHPRRRRAAAAMVPRLRTMLACELVAAVRGLRQRAVTPSGPRLRAVYGRCRETAARRRRGSPARHRHRRRRAGHRGPGASWAG